MKANLQAGETLDAKGLILNQFKNSFKNNADRTGLMV